VAGSSKHGVMISDLIQGRKFLDSVRNCQFSRRKLIYGVREMLMF